MDQIPWTIITAFISASAALIAVYISNKAHENRMELQAEIEKDIRSQEFKRAKLEEMYNLFQKWEVDISVIYLNFLHVYHGKASFNEVEDVCNKNKLQESGDYQKFQTILNLYFQDCKNEFEKVMEKRKNVLSYCSRNSDFNQSEISAFCLAQEEFETSSAKFKSFLADKAKSIGL